MVSEFIYRTRNPNAPQPTFRLVQWSQKITPMLMIRILLILHLTLDMLGPFHKWHEGESTDGDFDRMKLLVLTENKKVSGVRAKFNHIMISMPTLH